MKCDGKEPCNRVGDPEVKLICKILIGIRSVSTGKANVCMSKADEVARDTLAPSHQPPMRHNSDEVRVTIASPPMLIENGNVSLADATKHVLSGLTLKSAHLSSLSTPGSGLLHLDDSMAQINPGCCSLPTQPTEMTKSTEGSTTFIPPALQTSDFGSNGLDDPIRTYGSDQTL